LRAIPTAVGRRGNLYLMPVSYYGEPIPLPPPLVREGGNNLRGAGAPLRRPERKGCLRFHANVTSSLHRIAGYQIVNRRKYQEQYRRTQDYNQDY
jgi:hypothetical protein